MVASLDFNEHSKVKSVHSEPAGERFKGRQGWLLAGELLCHCCSTKLVGITVQAAAVTRAVHSNHTHKGKQKACFGYANVVCLHIRSQPHSCWFLPVAVPGSGIKHTLVEREPVSYIVIRNYLL